MKLDSHSHFHFYSRIGISLLIFAFGFFLLQESVSTTAQVSLADNIDLTGWAWSEKAGWISLSCNNDFDGDGTLDDTCATNNYGLKVRHIDGDADTPYIQGCAWAGTPLIKGVCDDGSSCEDDADCLSGACDLSPAGWLCFSDPLDSLGDIIPTNAPTEGIPIRQTDWQEQETSLCVVEPGACSNDPAYNCFSYGSCPVPGSWCIQPLFRGVCALTSEEDALNDLIGVYDPLNDTPPVDFDHCYISSNCEVDENCYYPQVAGRGDCAVNNNGVITYSGEACTYDMNCPSGYYCEINTQVDFIAPPPNLCADLDSDGTADDCSSGYRCDVGEIIDFPAYPNALNYSLLDPKASWLEIAASDGVEGNDLVGFPIQIKLAHSIDPNSPFYDPDDPDLAIGYFGIAEYSSLNPINGCFNCYEEKTLKCAPDYTDDCTTEGGSDADCLGYCQTDKFCSNNTTKPCIESLDCQEQCEVRDIKQKCANCLEYFYYKDEEVLRCDNVYQFPCTEVTTENSPECSSGVGGACKSYPANQRCSGNNYFYCNIPGSEIHEECLASLCEYSHTSCTTEDDCPILGDCKIREACLTILGEKLCAVSHTSCSSSADCPILQDYGTCVIKTPGDLEKVLAGYNCAGDTTTVNYTTIVGSCAIQNIDNSCTLNSYNKNINSCGSCEAVFKTTGVMLDNQHNRLSSDEKASLCGWAQSPAFGWINFSPHITTSTKPYFSVEQGNIYSKSRIVTLYHPPFSKYNASYLIESGGSITNFVSQVTAEERFQGEMEYRPEINFLSNLTNTTKYTNALGKLDYKGLITVAKTIGLVDYNKYGGVIEEAIISDVYADNAIFDEPFNNKVFHIKDVPDNYGDGVEFGSGDGVDLLVKCGEASVSSGAGVIVVEGNMKIKNNIKYDSSCTINNLKQIPSLVWVVKGDVVIDATTVSEVAGTFIILGDGGDDCSEKILKLPYQPLARVGCGQFKSTFINTESGAPWSPDNLSLTVSGNVLARNFVLARTKTNPNGDPAEKFINDGRLQSNPPLGLTDMSRVIPRFSSY